MGVLAEVSVVLVVVAPAEAEQVAVGSEVQNPADKSESGRPTVTISR